MQWIIESRIDGQRTLLTAAAQLEKLEAGQHYAIGVIATPAGVLWSADDYRNRRNAFQKKFPNTDASALAAEFPTIGERAMQELESFGPEGATHSLTFTSADGRNDVKLTLSAHLPSRIPDPQCDLEKLAKSIEKQLN